MTGQTGEGRTKQMKALQVHERDNVATAISEVRRGEAVTVLSPAGEVVARPVAATSIGFGHKLAISALRSGQEVIKYGEVIGTAGEDIDAGALVHTHNVESSRLPAKGPGRGIL